MAIVLTLPGNGLEFHPGLPADYSGPVLQDSIAISSKSHLANLVIQELACDQYSVRFSIGRFFKKVTTIGNIGLHGLYSFFMLKNGFRKEINTIGKIHLRQGHYTCLHTKPTACQAHFEKNTDYELIDLFYSPRLLQELLPFFPELENVLSASPAAILPGKAGWTLPSMKGIISQLLNCPYDESTRRFYFDLKVRELLFHMLENAYKRKPMHLFFTPWEMAKIHDARAILQSYISKKPPRVKSLARLVALNEFKLKTGFRQYYNAGMFEWLMEQKMQHAKQLILNTNQPIKEISAMIGYPLTTNFITAFRRHFGVTPGTLRRK